MDKSQIGLIYCCGTLLIPGLMGGLVGAWFQRRINRLGWPGALVPGFITKLLERFS